MNLGPSLLKLPVTKRRVVFSDIVTSGLIYYTGGNWRSYFKQAAKTSSGLRSRIYERLQALPEERIELIYKTICEK